MDFFCNYCREECPSGEHCVSPYYDLFFCTPECHRGFLRARLNSETAAAASEEDARLETLYGRQVVAAPPPAQLACNNLRGKGLTRTQWLPKTRETLNQRDAERARQFDYSVAQSQRRAVHPLKQKFI